MRNWFDKYVWDRPYYQDLITRHDRYSMVALILPINIYLLMIVSALLGWVLGEILT